MAVGATPVAQARAEAGGSCRANIRTETDSPSMAMPTTAVPAAPIPVHTAYAGPTSSFRSAMVSARS